MRQDTDEVAETGSLKPPRDAARPAPRRAGVDPGLLREVEVALQVRLGEALLTVADLLALQAGAVLKLDRRVGEAVEVYLRDNLVARGEIVTVDDNFGIRLTELGPR